MDPIADIQLIYSHDFHLALIAAGSSLIGALVGGLAVVASVYFQYRTNRYNDIDRRLFDARRDTYEKALAAMTHAHSERLNGRMYPTSSSSDENRKVNDILASVTLFSTPELVSDMRNFFNYLARPLPTNEEEKKKDTKEGIIAWQALIQLMRKDLGTGKFLE